MKNNKKVQIVVSLGAGETDVPDVVGKFKEEAVSMIEEAGLVAVVKEQSSDEVEKDKFIEQLGKEKFTIQRSKGLGENEPDMMNLTTMNPESRRLIKVLPADAEQTAEIFDVLLGDNLQGRKDYIVEHGNEYIDQLDVS